MSRIGRTTKDTGRRDEWRLREVDRKVGGIGERIRAAQEGPVASLYQTAPQTIPSSSAAWTLLRFDVGLIDSHAGFDPSDPTRYICQVAGFYQACGVGSMVGAGGMRGVALQRGGVFVKASAVLLPATTDTTLATPTKLLACNVGDFISVAVFQDSGVALDTAAYPSIDAAAGSALDISWRGPLPATTT